ncbi:MAG: isoleucine--tRNA ligase [Desulfobacterales bacterium]|nr:isoleucine--tRNA ligase [Desulfobacterales bacterium]
MDYKDTLNLPSTKFKMKANLPNREPEMLKSWAKAEFYKKVLEKNIDNTHYILHDGPPYANGHLHMGHAINKILKDIIIRSKQMAGFYARYVPGWDCHGLPIEHAVDLKLGSKKKEITVVDKRKLCRDFANNFVGIQRDEFKRFGVAGEWDDPYLTMNYEYEARIAKECAEFALNGNMSLGKKPIYWCCSCQTALAEAEIEYHDHTSPSIYVKFPLKDDISDLVPEIGSKNAFFVIWTTTPWTIPANLGICLHPEFTYSAVDTGDTGVLIIAKELCENVMKELGIENYTILGDFDSKVFENKKCKHPLYDRDSLVILGDHVTLEAGTGCVHTAPGHGADDHIVGKKYGLETYSPVENDGTFSEDVEFFKGEFIFKANKNIVEKLSSLGLLLKNSDLSHSYPHCWRCKKPVIYRATSQWFLMMEKHDLRKKSLEEINNVQWIPSWGKARIYSMIENRPDWCLSRQRSWGVPIALFHCKKCKEVYVTRESVDKIYTFFREYSSDIWFEKDAKFLMPPNAHCAKCDNNEFEKDANILDVWFDSGVSHAAVLEEKEGLSRPADLYLEGSDQHRGWFHSSLLTSVGSTGKAPYKAVLTHGFVVDAKGRKMSKSVGNVIAPEKIIQQYGADILRLWTAASDYSGDVSISDNILKQLSDAYRRIRNTCRFMLGNLFDFDVKNNMILIDSMSELDRFILHQFSIVVQTSLKAYEDFEFHKIYHTIYNFCTVDLSSFYLDIIKDRLYVNPKDDIQRRNSQTMMYIILDSIVRLMAPVLPFTSDEIWQYMPEYDGKEESVSLASMAVFDPNFKNEKLSLKWKKILNVRSEVTKALEEARIKKLIGHPLDAAITIELPDQEYKDIFASLNEDLRDLFIVSKVSLSESVNSTAYQGQEVEGLKIHVESAPGEKCERCWRYDITIGENTDHPKVCLRCVTALEKIL